jgi:predicted aspartyl protease
MRFDGQWLEFDDGIVRPVIRAEVFAGDQEWRAVEFLVDTGADRTVMSANVLESLNLETSWPQDRIAGVGGLVESVVIATQIRLTRDDGEKAVFRGSYSACTDHEALDMSVLGRDLLEMFAVIVDRRSDIVTIIGGQHQYTIERRNL